MRIFEIFDNTQTNPELDYDIQDDLIYWINNDSMFYRKTYYPFAMKVHARFKHNKPVSAGAFASIVKSAYAAYKQQFPIPGQPDTLSDSDIREISVKLHNEELSDFRTNE